MTIITDKLLLLQNDFSNVIFFSARISPRNTPAEICTLAIAHPRTPNLTNSFTVR